MAKKHPQRLTLEQLLEGIKESAEREEKEREENKKKYPNLTLDQYKGYMRERGNLMYNYTKHFQEEIYHAMNISISVDPSSHPEYLEKLNELNAKYNIPPNCDGIFVLRKGEEPCQSND